MSQELLPIARAAARAGAHALRNMWGRELNVQNKAQFDYVTEADRKSERAVSEVIKAARPDSLILAEESAGDWARMAEQPGLVWIVDPLDGTTNFIHGFPHVAVSVAACQDGQLAAGVVRDVLRGEEFSAAAGRGAWLNGNALKVSQVRDPGSALLLTGFPFRIKPRLKAYLALFSELFDQFSGIRRAGSAALDLAYVAAGRAEGFWELGLMPWDVAAGVLLVKEAGGIVSDFSGGGDYLWQEEMVAGNPFVHPVLQRACARHLRPGQP
jgi:myo-inositol-1(or 4)-monophosphatase